MSESTASVDRIYEVFDLLGPLYRRIHRTVERDTAALGLSAGTRAVLVMLRQRGPMPVPRLAEAQALSRQFTQRVVNEALARGLVASVANPAHRRSRLIALTESGTILVDRLLEREHGQLAAAAAELDGADFDGCVRVLSRLLRLVEAAEPGPGPV